MSPAALSRLLAALLAAACLAGLAPQGRAASEPGLGAGPADSLQRAVEAFARGDAHGFERYVDAGRVVDRAVRDYLRASLGMELPESPDGDELLLNDQAVAILAPSITGQVMDGLKQMLVAAPQQGLSGIGLPRSAFNPDECVSGPLGDPGIKFFRGVDSVNLHDDKAVVRMTVHHAGLGLDLPVYLGLERREGYWQVVELLNVAENVGLVMGAVAPGWKE